MDDSAIRSGKKIDIAPYRDYICEIRDFLNDRFRQHGLQLHVSTTNLEQRLDLLAVDRVLRSMVSTFAAGPRFQSGRVYRSQIATAVDVIAASLQGNRNLAIMGATQSGKSGTFYLLMAIEPVCHFLTHQGIVVPIVSLVNKNDLYHQLRTDFESFFRLHEGLCFESNGRRIHIAEYFHDHIGVDYWEDSSFDPSQTLLKNSVQNIVEFRDRLMKAKVKNLKVIDYIDESHHGSAAAGVFDRMASEHIKAANEQDGHVDFRAVSATNWEHSQLDHFEPKYQYLEKGYRGIPYFNGKRLPCLDADYEPTPPKCRKYTDLGIPLLSIVKYETLKRFRSLSDNEKIKHLKDKWHRGRLSRRRLNEMIRKLKARPDSRYRARWLQYRADFVGHIATIIENTVINAGEPNVGICIRASRRNSECAELMEAVLLELARRGQANEILAIPYFGQHERSTVQQTIDQENPEGNCYAVFITAGARMGVTFPSSCRFFVDLTDDPTTSTAEIQGTFGRATGYFRDNMVFVSPACLSSINHFVDNKGVPAKRPHQSVRLGNALPGRPITYVTLHTEAVRGMEQCDDKQRLLELIGLIEKEILRQKAAGWAWVKMQRKPKNNANDLWPLLEEIACIVERNPVIAAFQRKTGGFEQLRLLHWHAKGRLRSASARDALAGSLSKYADEKGRTFGGEIARRVRYPLENSGAENDRGRTTGGREIERKYKEEHVEPQLYFDVLGATRADKDHATGVQIKFIHFPLREFQSRNSNLELTDRSAWYTEVEAEVSDETILDDASLDDASAIG